MLIGYKGISTDCAHFVMDFDREFNPLAFRNIWWGHCGSRISGTNVPKVGWLHRFMDDPICGGTSPNTYRVRFMRYPRSTEECISFCLMCSAPVPD